MDRREKTYETTVPLEQDIMWMFKILFLGTSLCPQYFLKIYLNKSTVL